MKSLILVIGDDLRANPPFLEYLLRSYAAKFGVLDDIKFIKNNDSETSQILDSLITSCSHITIFASKESYMVISKILSSLKGDIIELNERKILAPATSLAIAEDSFLIKIDDCLINLIKAVPLKKLPEILMQKPQIRRNFYIFDFDSNEVAQILAQISPKYKILCHSTQFSKYLTLVRAKELEFGKMDGFLKEIYLKFDKFMIFEDSLAEFITAKLREFNQTITFAESCSCGLLAAKFGEISGVSDIFKGSLVTYSNEIKHVWLNVSESVLAEYGAVSEECVSEMLDGAISSVGSDYALAISGIAGPTGGTPLKPVGTVFIGAKDAEGNKIIEECHISGNRDYIRNESVNIAMSLLLKLKCEIFF